MPRQLTSAAQAATIIRKALRSTGLQVKVRSHNASMTSGVDIDLVDQRPEVRKLVETYCANFQYGHFDGMTECYYASNKNEKLPQAKFVNVHNQMSDAMREDIYQFIRRGWVGGDNLPETYAEGCYCLMELQGEYVREIVYRLFRDEGGSFWRAERPLKAELKALAERMAS